MKDESGDQAPREADLADPQTRGDAPLGGQEIPPDAPTVPVVKAPGEPPPRKRKGKEEPES
jgi:hypothetical protein